MLKAATDKQLSVGFIGAGAMAYAMASGLVKAGLFTKHNYCDVSQDALEKCAKLSDRPSFALTTSCAQTLAKNTNVIVLALKPQVAPTVLPKLRDAMSKDKLIVSIMGGIPLATLRSWLGDGPRMARAMPNTALLVGHGTTGVSFDDSATQEDQDLVKRMFAASGYCAAVPEHLLDAVTGVSGSGPSYVSVFVEALADGGVKNGLPRALAQELAAHTVAGSGLLLAKGGVNQTGIHPGILKDMVCSPGGTSIYAVSALEECGLRHAVISATTASTDRAKEIGALAAAKNEPTVELKAEKPKRALK